MTHNTHGLFRENASAILVVQRLLDPIVTMAMLFGLAWIYRIPIGTHHIILAFTAFLLMLPVFKAVGLYRPYRTLSPATLGPRLLSGWIILLGVLLFLGFMTQTTSRFSRPLLLTWSVCVPLILMGLHLSIWQALRAVRAKGRNQRSAVLAGVNDVSYHLANQIQQCPELGIRLHGFFDGHQPEPTIKLGRFPGRSLIGPLETLPQYVREHNIDVVYLACINESDDVIASLIKELQDTTACVYFVPNILMFNLMNARSYELNGIPLIAVWEVPFSEIQYVLKRAIDIVLSLIAIILLSPVMLAIAIGVKLSSAGPILFKQRRYGLNGQEILVYKFRSMRVTEDGEKVTQATKNDSRITPLGKILRKTSLDELPQFINVLQGRMSLVGPRPHAVAHNEMYRKLISGYMLRHKVKPGITGWAQVNGFRGETDTLEKMQQRVNYDLEYLRNWSLSLDLQILVKTALVFLGDQNAY
ncbi:MAG TPA: undecaprenyl-phosphate glucose phosphotransferase [Stenomitos sp.]